jgi:hypothetical protein
MADKRGGYQAPKGPRPPSGPGRFSQRSDGGQPVVTPGLNSPDMQYGDVSKLRAAMSQVPLPETGSPAPAPGARPVRPTSRAGGLPDFLLNGPSNRPLEPGTAGLSTGPGPGPEVLPQQGTDPRLLVLQRLWTTYGSEQAHQMMLKIINESNQLQQQSNAPVPGQPAPGGAPA